MREVAFAHTPDLDRAPKRPVAGKALAAGTPLARCCRVLGSGMAAASPPAEKATARQDQSGQAMRSCRKLTLRGLIEAAASANPSRAMN
jgi:hypothetical protein